MELEDESSKSNLEESREEKVGKIMPFDSNRGEINGDHTDLNLPLEELKRGEESIEPLGSPSSSPKVNGDGIGEENKGELSPSSSPKLEANSASSKGKGLRKWRRIRRNLNKDGSGGIDSSLILKRRLSVNESSKARGDDKMKNVVETDLETPTPSAGSLRSTEAVEAVALDPELVQLVASGGFSIGMDSDNSEDRSSKSSTAASVPKPRHEIGFGRERTRIKNVGGRGGSSIQQRTQRGRGAGVDSSKKIRGDRGRLEKENSQSSVESDLRSSNVSFVRWGSGVSNGKHSEKALNFDLEQGDEAQTCEEVRSGYYKENGVVEDSLGGDLDPDLLEEEKKVKRENFRQPSGIDPFVESIVMLQTAKEALETEIQKFGEIGKAAETSDLDDQSEETEVSSSPAIAAHLVALNQKIEHFQYRLDEASATVKAKELEVLELKNIIKRTQSPKNEASTASDPIFEEINDLEFKLEDLHKKKIQAEVEFLIMTRTTQSWKLIAEDQSALLEEQKSLAGDQAQITLRLRDAEDKAIRLKEQAAELEAHCSKLLQTEKVLKLQNKVCKFSLCCLIQLLLLFVACGLFLIQLMPQSEEIVPT